MHRILPVLYFSIQKLPDEYKNMEWFRAVDCSHKIANLISELNYGHSIGELISGRTEAAVKIKRLRRMYEKKSK